MGPDWEHELYVGNVAEIVLPDVSIDDYIFGVAAVGPDGHESLVTRRSGAYDQKHCA